MQQKAGQARNGLRRVCGGALRGAREIFDGIPSKRGGTQSAVTVPVDRFTPVLDFPGRWACLQPDTERGFMQIPQGQNERSPGRL
jgi:hypothetical protein